MASPDESCHRCVNAANFVTVKPWLKDDEKTTKYKIWKEQMICLVESQGLLEFINGEMDGERSKYWKERNSLVKGWMLGSVGEDVLGFITGLHTARNVWLELEKIFERESADSQVDRLPMVTDAMDSIMQTTQNEIQEADNNTMTIRAIGDAMDFIVETTQREIQKVDESTIPSREVTTAKDYNFYLPLYTAIIRGDLKVAKDFFYQNGTKDTAIARINHDLETALHVAVISSKSYHMVKELVNIMPLEAVFSTDKFGYTALHTAGKVGNMEAVDILVTRFPNLLHIVTEDEKLPVHLAAINSHKVVLNYLILKHEIFTEHNPFMGISGVSLLIYVIASHILDVAFSLVDKYPDLMTLKDKDGYSALSEISGIPDVFRSGESFNWWENLIYNGTPLEFVETAASMTSDIKNYSFDSMACDIEKHDLDTQEHRFGTFQISCLAFWRKLYSIFWKVVLWIVPNGTAIIEKKIMHHRACKLVKCMCQRLKSLPYDEANDIFAECIIRATKNGIHEVVELIIEAFPVSIFYRDSSTSQSIFHLAVVNRCENVFNLIYQIGKCKHFFVNYADNENNNLMHLSAVLAPPHKLNLVPGAALQMQREFQWFKEMENFITVSRRGWKNKHLITPKMIFTEEHKTLKADGEKWMKDTASSCSIAAALIATVVFAATFTLPGGIDNTNGNPIFRDKFPFILFTISNAVSLFTSVTALLAFLSILTSRYAEEDFLYILPKRLCIGLLTIFASLIFMLIAFSAALYLIFEEGRGGWLFILIVALACLPVSSFVFLQFPLLVDVLQSTYGTSIFGKKSDKILY